MDDLTLMRRNLILLPLLASCISPGPAEAGVPDPAETLITLKQDIPWKKRPTYPENSVTSAPLVGSRNGSGLYCELIQWFPGYMSAPHFYATDRCCMVVSGIWWVNSGADFDPARCVPVPAGSFVRRVAGTPHYDGVIAGGKEPAIIAICGIAPVAMQYIEPNTPPWRAV